MITHFTGLPLCTFKDKILLGLPRSLWNICKTDGRYIKTLLTTKECVSVGLATESARCLGRSAQMAGGDF